MSRRPLAALLLASVALLSACGGDGESAAPAPSPTPSAVETFTPTPRATVATAAPVTVTETEYALELSRTSFTPGAYTFTYTNAGKEPHNLAIEGPSVNEPGTSVVTAGQSGQLQVTLRKGRYELWCAVGDHRRRGMSVKITVA